MICWIRPKNGPDPQSWLFSNLYTDCSQLGWRDWKPDTDVIATEVIAGAGIVSSHARSYKMIPYLEREKINKIKFLHEIDFCMFFFLEQFLLAVNPLCKSF